MPSNGEQKRRMLAVEVPRAHEARARLGEVSHSVRAGESHAAQEKLDHHVAVALAVAHCLAFWLGPAEDAVLGLPLAALRGAGAGSADVSSGGGSSGGGSNGRWSRTPIEASRLRICS